jgi:hypothetical protein
MMNNPSNESNGNGKSKKNRTESMSLLNQNYYNDKFSKSIDEAN